MPYRLAAKRIAQLLAEGGKHALQGGKKGLEKESLRIHRDGSIAQTPHPEVWGSALTHPYITTDYSEALTELITPAFSHTEEVTRFLHELHQFLYQHSDPNELLWNASMPCAVADDRELPIAYYGTSNIGRMKHVYRVGLDYRYGRRMQAIAGVHFNYSLPVEFWPVFQALERDSGSLRDFIDRSYFALIRNFRRLGWLVPLLFGTSPAVCSCFLGGRTTRFKSFDASTYYLPYATSLRMSDIGYKNKNQAVLRIAYDTLDQYVASLSRAIRTPYPEYEVIGLKDGDAYIQLNTNLLQIENEFYSYMRPKRTTRSGEKPTVALRERGVEYVEMRALDVYSFAPSGVYEEQLRFLEAFMIFCLLAESPQISPEEQWTIDYNELTVAMRGREPGLALLVEGERRPVIEWAENIFTGMEPICELLDANIAAAPYTAALRQQRAALADLDSLPSARLLAAMTSERQTFSAYMLAQSEHHARYFKEQPLSASQDEQLRSVAADSWAKQREIEAHDKYGFDEYLARYFAGNLS